MAVIKCAFDSGLKWLNQSNLIDLKRMRVQSPINTCAIAFDLVLIIAIIFIFTNWALWTIDRV